MRTVFVMLQECRTPFGAKSFYDYEGLPYCEMHFHARRGSLCVTCNQPVTGRCVTAMYRKYHPEHFVCTYCQRQLNKGTFKEQNGKPYCQQCFGRLFSWMTSFIFWWLLLFMMPKNTAFCHPACLDYVLVPHRVQPKIQCRTRLLCLDYVMVIHNMGCGAKIVFRLISDIQQCDICIDFNWFLANYFYTQLVKFNILRLC